MIKVLESGFVDGDDLELEFEKFTKEKNDGDEMPLYLQAAISLKKVEYVYMMLRNHLQGKKTNVKYALHDPTISTGYVTAEMDTIVFHNIDIFEKMFKFSDNVEVCPMSNGKVSITFGFNDLYDDSVLYGDK